MKRTPLLLILVLLALVGVAAAQEATPVPVFGPIVGTPTSTPALPATVPASEGTAAPGSIPTRSELPAVDARASACGAYTLPGFRPYIVQPGDRIGDLLVGADNITITQLAALNCLDDPLALPVGATIWIPAQSAVFTGLGATPAATLTPFQSVAVAEIRSLSINPTPVLNLEGGTVTWDATGTHAYFYACPVAADDDDCARPVQAQPLPVQHSLTLAHFPYAGTHRYRLEVIGSEQSATRDLTFDVQCSQRWLGPVTGLARCPETPPLAVFGAWQPFEGGVMIYFSDTSEIYVMTNADHQVRVFPDTFVEGMTEVEFENVPEGRFPARRGFGIIWNSLGGPESPLGWALAEEIGYDSARQAAGRISYTTYIQGPGDTVYAVTLLPGADSGYWTQVAG